MSATTYHEALARTSSVQKTAKGAPAYSRFVNRRLGRHLAAMAYALDLTPDLVTVVSACFSFTGIALVAIVSPTPVLGLLVCLCLVLGYAFDSADGQLARLRGGGSPAGEWLDHMVDCAKISALHIAVLISVYRWSPTERAAVLLLPAVFGAVSAVFFFGTILTDLLRRARTVESGATMARVAEPAPLVRSLLVLPTDYGVLCLVFLTLGAPTLFLWSYGTLFAGTTVFLLLVCVKWYREVRSFGAAAAPVR